MASQHYINLSANEMSVVASAKKNGKGWICKVCKQNFGDVVPLVTHLLTSCDNKNKTFETSSLVNVCVHLDPNGCQKMLESYIRVYGVDPRIQTAMGEGTSVTDNSTIDDDETMTDDSAIDSSNKDSKGKAPAELDALDHDLLGHDQSSQASGGSQDGANAAPAGSEFAATPPEWLSDKDKVEWRVRQDQHTKMTGLRAIHRTSKDHTDWKAVLAAWNTTYAIQAGYNSYSGGNTMATRISRDKGILLALQAKKPANWDATH